MILTNQEIYEMAKKMPSLNASSVTLPIKLSFRIKKNAKQLLELGREIEENLFMIYEKYNIDINSNEPQKIDKETVDQCNSDIADLMNIKQDINLLTINLSDIPEDTQISMSDMDAILFMIDEEKED